LASALIYVTGGVAFANFKNTYDARPIGGDRIGVSSTHAGWTVGGGISTIP
jgi:opacity protein-like surface antigen